MLTLAVNCTKSYLKHLDVLLWSVVLSEEAGFKVYLIHDGIDVETLTAFKSKWSCLGAIVIDLDASDFILSFRLNSNFPPICFGRLLIPKLIKKEERVLSLDIDIVVLKPLSALYDIDMLNFPIACSLDSGTGRGLSYFQNLIFPKIINAGVLLIDLENTRSHEKFTEAKRIAQSKYLKYADQDAINRAFFDDIMILDQGWNWQKLALNEDASIKHFAHSKPWDKTCVDKAYGSYLTLAKQYQAHTKQTEK